MVSHFLTASSCLELYKFVSLSLCDGMIDCTTILVEVSALPIAIELTPI
jgi:hypothetical protein